VSALRVALVAHGGGAPARDLEATLRAAGHEAALIAPAPVGAVEAALRFRGFTGPLTHVPRAFVALAQGGFDVAHAFSAPDALAAHLFRRRAGRPAVFTCAEVLDRSSVADRRLRLRLLAAAVEDSDAVLAASEAAQEALWRWMAVEAPVVAASDAAGHERVYRALLAD
jgi:Glycosyltransferase Family 4